MNVSLKNLSDIVTYMKYSKYDFEKGRKETWEEIVDRNKNMHLKKFPSLKSHIEEYYKFVYEKKVFPSMRQLQFGGEAIEKNNMKGYNCSYLPVDVPEAFSEIFYILLCGTGVGYSVQSHHVNNLPSIKKPKPYKDVFVIEDSIEGWADSILALFKCYIQNPNQQIEIYDQSKVEEILDDISNIEKVKSIMKKVDFDDIKGTIEFDYSLIRPKGSLIKSSTSKAPGPEGLKKAHKKIVKIFSNKKDGEKLTPLECHDIICHIADCVLSGGVRRSSLISFFDLEDKEMLMCKTGDWYVNNPQRSNANNSGVFYRKELTKERFENFFDIIANSGSGEPGIFLTNDKSKNICSNPCAEISLNPMQVCNLCEIVAKDITSKEDFLKRVEVASFIGTLQASYTDFKYVRENWRKQTEEEALLGIGITGLASGEIKNEWLKEGAELAVEINKKFAKEIGINPSARLTTLKPSGTSSLVAGTSSGIHPWHAKYYIRRIVVLEHEPIFKYLSENHPELIETVTYYDKSSGEIINSKHTINIPIEAPKNSILKEHEDEIDFLERVKITNENWIKPGWVSGINSHNISCTVSVKDWEKVKKWMWENVDFYNAIALLPYWEENNTYQQLPLETITEEKYKELVKSLKSIDLTNIIEKDFENFELELACSSGQCEI